jgi:hypothetical protein
VPNVHPQCGSDWTVTVAAVVTVWNPGAEMLSE